MWRRLVSVFRKQRLDRELDEELQSHLQMLIDEHLRRGMSFVEARYAALSSFGGVEQVAETYRDRRGLPALENFVRDLRYAVRTLARSPGFALAASFILALGIAATTTTFSIANAVLLRPMPFPNPEQLVSVFEWTPRGNREGVSPATFLDWRVQNRCFANLATSRGLDINLTGAGEPEQLGGATVSEGMFEMLGSGPALGRSFRPDDYSTGAARVVMLSHGFWQRRFAGDRKALGKVIHLGAEPYTIVGIMPANFWFFWGRMDVWTPLRFTSKDLASRGGRMRLMTIGRMKRGIQLAQAQAEMEALASRLVDRHRDMNGWGVKVRPLREQDEMVRRARPALLLLLAAVGVVMLIVCANLANLLLVRGSGRAREIAIRSALGARRSALIAQLLIESLVLAGMGCALGILLSVWGIRFTSTLIPEDLRLSLPSGPDQIGVNMEVLLFSFTISLGTGLLFGLAPALRFSKANLTEALKSGGRAAGQGRRQRRLHDLLVAAEIALSLVLLIGAALLLESYVRMYRRDLGYRPEGVQAMLLLGIKQRPAGEIVRRVAALPGVEAAGTVGSLPGWPVVWPFDFRRIEIEAAAGESSARALYNFAGHGYLDAMGFTLLQGRRFTEEENLKERFVTVVNQELARRYSLGPDPIGKRIRPADSPPGPWLAVVGVVSDERHPLSGAPLPALYRPGVQQSPPYLIVRGSAELTPTIRRQIWSVSPDQPVLALGPMDKIVAEARSPVRFGLVLLGSFAAAALTLAAMGIYAVMAYIVKARSHEIGVRMALGARKTDILGLVLRRALGVALRGVAAGTLIAWAGAGLLSRMLYGISATDPLTFGGVSVFLVMVSIAAAYLPARRAARIDPISSLKYE